MQTVRSVVKFRFIFWHQALTEEKKIDVQFGCRDCKIQQE